MANTRELRRRIKSIKNTSQITKAMQMVAATKMRKAQVQAESGNPYTQTLNETLKRLTQGVDQNLNPLMQENDAKNIGVIILSTDKGLVGALNTNLFRTILASHLTSGNVNFYTVGRKGRQFVVKIGKILQADFENLDIISFRQAKQLGKLARDAFLGKELKEVYLVYPDFVSTLTQVPKIVKLLPIDPHSVIARSQSDEAISFKQDRHADARDDKKENQSNKEIDFLFEPDPSSLLDYVLSHSIEAKIYHALLETKASEHSARMVAMQNATDNALELVDDLTLSYNQVRQESITKEILEITTAQAALE